MEVRILKKNFRRAMAAVMAAALTFSLAGTAADADAAKKKIKLASKSVTVTVKKTKTVKIKNVKAKKVKKLTVKSASKKIATAKAKGKTAVKVTGKKAGKSTKVKITLKIKGQKKATKLTLKVKVKAAPAKKPTVNPPAPATNAPGPNVPAVTQPPAGGNGTAAPATDAPATEVPVTKPPTEKPTQKPEWTPDPEKKVEDVTLTYGNGEGFMFEKADMVKFEDADNYPEEGIDVRYYDSVTVKYTSDEEITSGDEGWGGKATLSSTDEGLGCTAYTDGLYRRYLNDLPYENGGYTVQYNMKDVGEAGGLLDGYDFEEVGLIDCVSVQLESNTHPYVDSEDQTQKGVNFRLMSIEFKAPEKPVETDAPSAAPSAPAVTADPGTEPTAPAVTADPGTEPTAPAVTDAPTPEPTAPAVTLDFKHNLAVGETTKVEVVAEGAEIVATHLAVADTTVAELAGDVLTAKKIDHEGTTIGGTVDLTVSGKTFTDVPVEEAAIRVFAADELIINVTDLEGITLIESETAAIEAAATVELGGKPVTDATLTAKWTIIGSAATINSQSTALKNVVTAETAGTATVYLTVTAVKGDKTVTSLQKKAAITVKKAGEIKLAGGKTSINIGETAGIVLEGVEGTIQNVVWEIVKAKAVEAPVVNATEGESTPAETAEPTKAPTQAPTKAPTQAPTKAPTEAPAETVAPTEAPTQAPTKAPTEAPAETVAPTEAPKPVVVGDATVEADEDEPAKAVVTGTQAGTVTVKATVTVKKADDSIRTYVVTGEFEVNDVAQYDLNKEVSITKEDGVGAYRSLGWVKVDPTKVQQGDTVAVKYTALDGTVLQCEWFKGDTAGITLGGWMPQGITAIGGTAEYGKKGGSFETKALSSDISNEASAFLSIQNNAAEFMGSIEITSAKVMRNGSEVEGAVTAISPKYEFPGLTGYTPIVNVAFGLTIDELSEYEKAVVTFDLTDFKGNVQAELMNNTQNIYEDKNSVQQKYGIGANKNITAEFSLDKLAANASAPGIIIQTAGVSADNAFKDASTITMKEVKLIAKS